MLIFADAARAARRDSARRALRFAQAAAFVSLASVAVGLAAGALIAGDLASVAVLVSVVAGAVLAWVASLEFRASQVRPPLLRPRPEPPGPPTAPAVVRLRRWREWAMAVGNGRCVGPPAMRKGPLRAIHCILCGYAHLDPRPSPDRLDELYRSRYYTGLHPGWLRKEWRERAWLFATARYRLAILDRFGPPGTALLDVGCSWGWFVAEAVRQGWDAVGYDPADAARDFARIHLGLDLLPAADLGQHPNSLAAVTASLVLEHLPAPAEFFSAAFRDLRPGGLLMVVVPNEFNPLQLALNARGYVPVDPLHVNYFTPESLDALARAAGFEPVHKEATFPMELLALVGLDYVAVPALGRVAHAVRKAWERAAYALFPAPLSRVRSAVLRRLGWGREVLAVYRKPRLAPEAAPASAASDLRAFLSPGEAA